MNNDPLMDSLDMWARKDARICPDVSTCRFYGTCNAAGILNGKHCTMSYVGREFGSPTSFRLAVVGMDHGDQNAEDFEKRRLGIERYYQNGGCEFSQHYAGVVKTAAAVLGAAGDRCGGECKRTCQKASGPSLACVLDHIAQPNVVKCVPDDAVNRTSKTRDTMWANCAHHLVAELKILRPQLVVFHGAKAKWAVSAAIKPDTLSPVDGITNRQVLYEWPALGTYLLFLSHPSRGWLDRQWDMVVVPSLQYLRTKGYIPV